MRVRTVRIDDGARLHADITGDQDGAVTVIFCHGWTLRSQSWTPVLRSLRALNHDEDVGGTRFIRYDQRGHGQSTWGTTAAVTVDRLGEDLAEVIAALAPSGPLVLAGHSMGGMTIMALAAAHPELVKKRVIGVVLVSTAAGGLADRHPRGGRIAHLVRNVPAPLLAVGRRYPGGIDYARRILPPRFKLHQRQLRRLAFGPEAPLPVVRACAEMIHATPSRIIVELYPALLNHDKRAQLSALASTPVAVVVGRRDALTPVRHSRVLAEEIPGASLHVEPDTGHMLLMERPHVVAAPIRRMVYGSIADSDAEADSAS